MQVSLKNTFLDFVDHSEETHVEKAVGTKMVKSQSDGDVGLQAEMAVKPCGGIFGARNLIRSWTVKHKQRFGKHSEPSKHSEEFDTDLPEPETDTINESGQFWSSDANDSWRGSGSFAEYTGELDTELMETEMMEPLFEVMQPLTPLVAPSSADRSPMWEKTRRPSVPQVSEKPPRPSLPQAVRKTQVDVAEPETAAEDEADAVLATKYRPMTDRSITARETAVCPTTEPELSMFLDFLHRQRPTKFRRERAKKSAQLMFNANVGTDVIKARKKFAEIDGGDDVTFGYSFRVLLSMHKQESP